MAGVNRAILVGFVGRDPDVKRTNDGKSFATFSLATSETWRDKATGERKEAVEWHPVVVFNENLVKVVEQYVKKGSRVYVEGAIKTRKWTDQAGQERARTALLDRAERATDPDEGSYGSPADAAPAASRAAQLDDDIPF